MIRRALVWRIVLALVLALAGVAGFLVATETGLRILWPHLARALPGKLAVESLEGKLIGPVDLRGLRYQNDQNGASLSIQRLELDWRPAALLAGQLRIKRLRVNDAMLALPPAARESGRRQAFTAPRLPLALTVSDARLQRVGVTPAGGVPVFVESASFDFSLDERALELRSLEASTELLSLAVRGRVALADEAIVDLRVDWSASPPGYEKIRGGGTIAGPLARLHLDQRLESPAGARLQAVLHDWSTNARWEARLQAEDIDVRRIKASWPGLATSVDAHATGNFHDWRVEGKLRLRQQQRQLDGAFALRREPGSWTIDRLEIHAPGNAARLSAAGRYLTRPAPSLRLDADWRELAWPLADEAAFASRRGRLRLQGTPERYRLRLEAAVAGGYAPRGDWLVTGSGNTSRVDFERIEARLSGGKLEGKGRLAWQPRLAWRLALDGAATHLRSSGTLADRWDLQWEMRADNLGLWLPAGGALSTQGRVTGTRAAPRIVATARARDLVMKSYRLGHLEADVQLDLEGREESRIDVAARAFQDGPRSIDSLRLQGRGKASRHRLDLRLRGAGSALSLGLDGSYRERTWSGTLASAEFHSVESGRWTLALPGPFLFGPARVEMGNWCWRAQDARLCARLQQKDGEWMTAASADKLPLSLLRPLLPPDLRVAGTVSARADVRLSAKDQILGQADIRFSPGVLSYLGRDQAAASLHYDDGHFRLEGSEQGLEGRLTFALRDGDKLEGRWRLPRFVARADAAHSQAVEGELSARLGRLELLPAFIPDLEDTRGLLRAKFEFGGTLGQPRIAGRATLTDGAARLPRLGLAPRAIMLTAENDARGQMRFEGRLRSGGELRFNGNMRWPAANARDWSADLALKGERVQVARTPEAWVLASPDLRLRARPRRVDISGEIVIPEAKIEPLQTGAAVPVSRDVVLVNSPDGAASTRRWDLYSQVRVVLGDKVRFRGFGLSGNIAGSVTAVDDPARATTGGGELKIVDGKYEAYGRELDIERGRLIFAGGPIENPGIDARATRRVGEVTAGISVRGTLKSPLLTLFSEPPLSQADALSYLVLGRPLEQASNDEGRSLAAAANALTLTGGGMLARQIGARFGFEQVTIESGETPEEASLVVGRYLSPKLFVAYSVGLYEQINLLRLRYQLSDRWTVQTETGTHSGADLLFTIER